MANVTGKFGYVVRSPVSEESNKVEYTESKDSIKLSDNIYIFTDRKIGHNDNVFEGEVRNALYIRPCVIKFATISEQNVREAEILTKLGSHTNVIAIIQSGTYCDVFEERVYIALDKCHNENLRQYLANRKAAGIEFDLNQAIDFAKQIIVGVMYIHDNNVIHLDLKPSNILISQNLRLIKIADFGLSIVVKSPKSKVLHKRQFGTNGYRPMESFGNGEVSMRTDIFSLGTVLLHLLSNGNDVFGLDEHTFTHNVMNDIADTSGLLVCNPVATEHLIKCMVSKERCRRPSIWEVSDHPCWSGEEVESNIEYVSNDEVADEEQVEAEEKKIVSLQSDIDRDREFLNRMKKMGFDRKPSIVLFDDWSKQLYRFNHKNMALSQMHKYPVQSVVTMSMFTPVTCLGEYIYALEWRTAYKLEYGDAHASWKIMLTEVPGDMFSFVASPSDLYYVCMNQQKVTEFILFKYIISSDSWERLPDKPTPTYETETLCNDKFFYCFGGYSAPLVRTSVVERMDLKTKKWSRIADMTEGRHVTCAAECNEMIYTIGDDNLEQVVIPFEMYDPAVDQWTQLPSLDGAFTTRFFIISIDDTLLLISSKWVTDKKYGFEPFDDDEMVARIHSYDFANNQWEILVSELKDMHIQDAVVVQMSE